MDISFVVGQEFHIQSRHSGNNFYTLILENLKDKDLIVFDIFVRFGTAIEYTSGTDLVNLSQLFANEKISKKIILSTNQGKVVVSPFKKG